MKLAHDNTEEHVCDGCGKTCLVTSTRSMRGDEKLDGSVSILVRPFKLIANMHKGAACPIVCTSECLDLLGPEWRRGT